MPPVFRSLTRARPAKRYSDLKSQPRFKFYFSIKGGLYSRSIRDPEKRKSIRPMRGAAFVKSIVFLFIFCERERSSVSTVSLRACVRVGPAPSIVIGKVNLRQQWVGTLSATWQVWDKTVKPAFLLLSPCPDVRPLSAQVGLRLKPALKRGISRSDATSI